MRRDRLTIWQAMLDAGAVPIFTPLDLAAAKRVVTACGDAGAPVVELTNRADGTLGLFRDLAAWARTERPAVILGAGTIHDAPTAALFIDAGAEFVVAPIFDEETARLCNRRRVPYIPGCATPTEISRAEEFGAEIIKLFPSAALDGPAFVRSMRGPSPLTRLMPTNVEPTEAATRAWFAAGAAGLGLGPRIISDSLQADPDPSALAARMREFMGWVRSARDGS